MKIAALKAAHVMQTYKSIFGSKKAADLAERFGCVDDEGKPSFNHVNNFDGFRKAMEDEIKEREKGDK